MDNPLPKFFGIPFGKQNHVRNNGNDLNENEFKDCSALINFQVKAGFWNTDAFYYNTQYELRYLKEDLDWVPIDESKWMNFISIRKSCYSDSKTTQPSTYQCKFDISYLDSNGGWQDYNFSAINVTPPSGFGKDFLFNFAVYVYPADLSHLLQTPPSSYSPAFVTNVVITFIGNGVNKVTSSALLKNYGNPSSMTFRDQKWFWVQKRESWTDYPSTNFRNNMHLMLTDMSFINGGGSFDIFSNNGQKEYEERVIGGTGDYSEEAIARSNEYYCVNQIAFSSEACGNCFDYNIIQRRSLKCVEQWPLQSGNTLLNDCFESKNGQMCRNCQNEWDKEQSYYDPMRRGYCRKVNHKCPDGQGFFKPVADSAFMQKMCITCPVNCKTCYGASQLCSEKWPANLNSFTLVDGGLNIPECAVSGCSVCELTPCDRCEQGKIVKIGLVFGASTNSDWQGKRYSCIDEDQSYVCPVAPLGSKRLARVVHSRADKPDFCLDTQDSSSNQNQIEFFWNSGFGTNGLMGFSLTTNTPPSVLLYTECSSSCMLCNIIYPNPPSNCSLCDASNQEYNFIQSEGDMGNPCKGNALNDQCSSRNLTNSCISCVSQEQAGSIPPENFALTWKDAFHLECGCKSGFYWNLNRTECLPCPDYCKHCISSFLKFRP